MSWPPILAAVSLALWLYLLLGRSGFWRVRRRIEDEAPPEPRSWPPLIAVVPARNEAAFVATTLPSLLAQDYPGRFEVLLVDDHSDDGTGEVARRLAGAGPHRLRVIEAGPLPPRWSGKLWAVVRACDTAQRFCRTPATPCSPTRTSRTRRAMLRGWWPKPRPSAWILYRSWSSCGARACGSAF